MTTFDAPNKGWMADEPMVDPVPMRKIGENSGKAVNSLGHHGGDNKSKL